MILNTDLAYTAGFVDGEGNITLRCRHDRQYPDYHGWLTVSQNSRPVLEWMRNLFGLGRINQQLNRSGNINYSWKTNTRQAAQVLEQLLPYLKVKRSRAELYVKLYSVQGYAARQPIWLEWNERFPVRIYMLGDTVGS